jgi:stage II sporulation protein P
MRGKKFIERILICGMAVLTLPLFYVSFVKRLPSASDSVYKTAENAAKLALVTIFPPAETAVTAESETEAVPANNEAAPPKKKKTLKITSDDSGMISKTELRVMPSSEDEEGYVPDPPDLPEPPDFETNGGEKYSPDTENLGGTVTEVTYGSLSGANYINLPLGGQLRNLTDLKNAEIEEIVAEKTDFTLKADGTPEVLIYHTHATECYLPRGTENRYDTNFTFRSSDKSINIVSVGNAIKKELEAAGIGVIHDETLYDEESYNGSYEKSREGVAKILEENPTIKLVLDVHRDAVVRGSDEIASTVAEIDGKKAAQIMIISNCNGPMLKYPIPDFRKNLKTAAALEGSLETVAPGLCRPILFDYRQYNQDLSPGSLLIEVGSHGNTAEEAKYSGELIGKAIAGLAESQT